MTPHRPLPKTPDFPALEQQVLERWRERDIFRESVRRRQGAEEFVFYEGPPTANGRPGSHHVLARVFKDIFPRYQTMLGKYVERKGGWDCHGLPVEIAVEQKLGFKTKHDIERYGIAEFNQQCRESVFEFLEDWTALTERIGYWVDLEHPYRTLDPTYIESVWWALKTMWERDLLFEGHRVVPYCVRCGTALSSHEVAQGYEDVEDPSIYVTFPVTEPAGALRAGDRLLAWTTTPWTVLSHAALAVAPDLTYVRTEDGYVLAEARVQAVLGEDAQIAERFTGADMIGTRYDPPFDFIATEEYGPNGHTVLPGDFVSADDGTGIVHSSIAFGEDDYRLGQEQGIAVINPVRLDGTYDDRMGPYAGRWVKEADADIVEDLRERGRLLRAETYLHAYPALLALRHAAPLLRQAVVVRRHLEAARPPAGRQRDGRLAPGAHQARAHGALAGEQRRLGDLARALLGHAAAGVALRERPHRVHRVARRAGGEVRRDARGPAPALRRRRRPGTAPSAASRCSACPW